MNTFVIVFFSLISFLKGIGMQAGNIIYVSLFVIISIPVFAKVINGSYSKRELAILFGLFLFSALNLIIGHSPTLLFTVIALSSLKNIDVKKVLKYTFYARLTAFIMMIFLTFTGINGNPISIMYRNGEFISRHTLGYTHANEAHIMFSSIVFLYLFLNYKKLNFTRFILIFILNIAMYIYTLSRTGFVTVLLCLILTYFARKTSRSNKKNRLISVLGCSYIIFMIISFGLSVLYLINPENMHFVDVFLSGRLQYNGILLSQYVPSIFGNNMVSKIVNIDNGYISLLYEGGIILFFVISIMHFNMQKKFKNDKKIPELLLIFYYLSYSVTESFFPSISVNSSLILLSEGIFRGDNER